MHVNGTHSPSREEAFLMPETKAQRSEAARKGAATRKARERQRNKEHDDLKGKRPQQVSEVVDRSSELSDDVLKSLRVRVADRDRGGSQVRRRR